MIVSGFKPRDHILNRLIDVYCKSSNFSYAHQLFDQIPKPDIVARTTLITAYSAIGNLTLARKIFNETPLSMRDTVCYNAMITGYSRNNDGYASIRLFCEMRQGGFRPNDFTYTTVLSGVAQIVDVEKQCQQLHCAVIKSGTGFATSVWNALLSVYVRCASSPLVSSSSLMGEARNLFNEMPERDELSWTTMITGYIRNEDLHAARELLDGMDERIEVVWNAMISGYAHHNSFQEALLLFRKMRLLGIHQDEFTYTSVISTCANNGLFQLGKQVHAYILRTEAKPTVDFSLSVNNTLLTLYYKCGKLDEAQYIFNNMPVKDLVSWNAILSGYVSAGRIQEAKSFFKEMPERSILTWTVMISGLAQNGLGEEAMKLFNQMRSEGFEPCDYAFSGAITSCAALGALEHGRQLHAQLISLGFDSSLSAANALITMYARCGVFEDANSVFLTMPYIDSVSWNAMIAALSQHGHGVQAIDLFGKMLKADILPDRITFLIILSACSHAGLVKEGRHYFSSMRVSYGISPDEGHYARMIDLLCRCGEFTEAQGLIESMPFEPGGPIWEALLAGCRTHGNMDLGIQAAERLFELVPQHDGTYILLSNLYAAIGRWDDVAKVRKLMRDRGVKKEPGCSWIDVENMVHVFLVGDTEHPEVQAVYKYLEQLGLEMRKLGYLPDTKFVLHDMESEHKEYSLSTHSEKLAVAFGLMKLPLGASIRVFKNLRICGDCHTAIKFMSRVVGRDIIVRDAKRFHHFRNGECSCGNYW
ncbi:pentatricopeptide repeat-containing protein At1g25360-like [Prunus dulcis]|uniref:pentatricopeptide repeat-containing protein At1g25360-like n=1 Tax=Prunus dulcis TaxID=3755 RepID=UPI001482D7D3|nr:pentatricopeptide repeat-containing protein At1g25360-like [Prunus dulcis]